MANAGIHRNPPRLLGLAALLAAALAGCGGGGGDVAGDDETRPRSYAIGGTVSGLAGGGLVLQNNGGADLAVAGNGAFTFATRLGPGVAYAVTVWQQPAGQRCQVDHGSGVATHDVTDVAVTCADVSAVVLPLYPVQGSDWNDYLADDGATVLDASDQVCAGSRCLHGGELRVWRLPQLASCAGLGVSDALDAFDWVCDDRSGSVAVVSTGLRPGRGLADLLDFDALQWRENQILVKGAATLASPSARWWARPVVAAGSGGSLGLAHVYLVAGDQQATFTIDADRAALVVRPGAVLRGPGGGESVVSTGHVAQVWIEGTVEAVGAHRGVHLQQATHSVLRQLSVRKAVVGVALDWSHDNRLVGVHAYANGSAGIEVGALGGSARNRFEDVVVAHNDGDGLRLAGNPRTSPANDLRQVRATSNGGLGVLVQRQPDTRLEQVTAFANGSGGVSVVESASAWLSGLTVANNDATGLAASGTYLSLQRIVSVNNTGSGLLLSAGSFEVVDAALAANGQQGVSMTSAAATFSGLLRLGGNAGGDCFVGLGSTGLADGSCANAGGSDAVLTRGVSVAAAFVGKVTTDDQVNTGDTAGTALVTSLMDWTHFARPQRGWGRDGAAFPDAGQRGRCNTGTCRIWDWSLAAGDGMLRAAWAQPSGDVVLRHRWSAADATACRAVAGATWDAVAGRCTSTPLRRAVEPLGGLAGNDNGLCEAGERCVFAPNLGSYLGHGALVDAGAVSPGVITGVRLLRFGNNGY